MSYVLFFRVQAAHLTPGRTRGVLEWWRVPLAEMAELTAVGEPEGAIGGGDNAFELAEGQGVTPVVEVGVRREGVEREGAGGRETANGLVRGREPEVAVRAGGDPGEFNLHVGLVVRIGVKPAYLATGSYAPDGGIVREPDGVIGADRHILRHVVLAQRVESDLALRADLTYIADGVVIGIAALKGEPEIAVRPGDEELQVIVLGECGEREVGERTGEGLDNLSLFGYN